MKAQPRSRRMWIAAGLLAAVAASAQAQAQATADQVKAAYLHKFAGYVDWPPKAFADAASPIVVGVAGSEAVFAELTRLAAGRTVQGRAVEVRRIADAAPLADVHVAFVGKELTAEAAAALVAAYRGRPVLTVTDAPHGLDSGAVLNFVEIDRRVRFEAAPAVAELGGLHLSSRLLAVAQRVVGATP